MAYPIHHGITLADNSSVENLIVETLSADPSPLTVGRVYYNSTSNQYSMIVDESGTATVKHFGTKEALDTFIAALLASTGATKVGYAGHTGTNAQLTIAAGTVKAALDALAVAVDADRQDEADERAALLSTATGGDLVGVDATSGANAEFSTTAGTLQSVLDSIVTAVDAEIDARKALETSGTDTFLDKTTLDSQSVAGAVNFASSITVQGNLLVAGNQVTTISETVEIMDNKILLNSDLKGASLVVNGEFDADTDWTKGSVWAIAGGVATLDGSQTAASSISQSVNVVDQQVYEVSFTVLNYAAGAVRLLVDGVEVIANQTASGKYSAQYTATATGAVSVEVSGDTDFSGEVDAIALQPVYTPTEDSGIQVNRGTGGVVDLIMFDEAADVVKIPVWDSENSVFVMEEVGSKPYIDAVDATLNAAVASLRTNTGMQADGSLTWTAFDSASMAVDLTSETSLRAAIETINNELKTGGSDAIDALQSELDTTQTGAGLETTGSYSAYPTYNETTEPTGAHYIDSATSLKEADKLLDTQVKANADAISNNLQTLNTAITTETNNRTTADSLIQGELDTTQSGAGLTTAGNYTAHVAYDETTNPTGVHFINGATTLHAADKILDLALQQEVTDRSAAITAEASARSTADDTIEASAGLENDGSLSWSTFDSNTMSIDLTSEASLKAAIEAINVELKSGGGDVTAALQTELDDTQAGAGLAANGNYSAYDLYNETTAPAGAYYISGATTLHEADKLLDTQVKANTDAIATETAARTAQDDVIEASVGLNANGSLAAFPTYNVTTEPTGQHYIDGETTIRAALVELDDALKAEETARTTADTAIKTAINNQRFTYKSSTPALTHSILHNIDTEYVQVTVLVQGDDSKYRNDYVLVTEESTNELTITMTESRNVKVVVMAVDDIA